MSNNPTSKLMNDTMLNKLSSDDLGMKKEAQDAINDYTRVKMREDGFLRRILPPIQITNDELDRQVDTDKPVKVIDKEPDSPGAISVPFASLPMNRYIRGPRYRVMFDRILTPKFTKDVDELRTYDMDIRQILSDNSIKDMLAEEDGKFLGAVNSLLLATDSSGVRNDQRWCHPRHNGRIDEGSSTHSIPLERCYRPGKQRYNLGLCKMGSRRSRW